MHKLTGACYVESRGGSFLAGQVFQQDFLTVKLQNNSWGRLERWETAFVLFSYDCTSRTQILLFHRCWWQSKFSSRFYLTYGQQKGTQVLLYWVAWWLEWGNNFSEIFMFSSVSVTVHRRSLELLCDEAVFHKNNKGCTQEIWVMLSSGRLVKSIHITVMF